MVKITFQDMYDGYSEILVDGDPNELYGIVEDFFDIAGEAISDDLASSAARKFRTFAGRIGYPVSSANGRPAGINMAVDLPSGNISGVQPDAVDLSMSGVMDEMRAPEETGVFEIGDMVSGGDLREMTGTDEIDNMIGVPNPNEEESNAYR